ncbi:hypothetical protein ES702_05098 [subsurface metagenome]
MTEKQYIEHQIKLIKQLEIAANLQPYDPNMCNYIIVEMASLHDSYYHSRQWPLSLHIYLWIVALLSGAFILYTLMTELRFALEDCSF